MKGLLITANKIMKGIKVCSVSTGLTSTFLYGKISRVQTIALGFKPLTFM
jgi:hypothetical protein